MTCLSVETGLRSCAACARREATSTSTRGSSRRSAPPPSARRCMRRASSSRRAAPECACCCKGQATGASPQAQRAAGSAPRPQRHLRSSRSVTRPRRCRRMVRRACSKSRCGPGASGSADVTVSRSRPTRSARWERMSAAGVPVTLRRVDGSRPPSETERPDLSGYRGARPVRFGNDAASQLQLDVAGSVIEFACSLAAAGALPASLAAASNRLATWTVVHWNDADHGIWEIRGDPHRYTHSRVMQWAALRAAAAMAQRGLMRGDGETWRRTAADIHAAALPPDGAPLQLHDDGGGADAALSMAVSNGFLRPEDRRAAATLGLIVSRLVRSDLVERYEGSRDGIADRCAPFVFPMFWLATAQRALGR